MARVFTERHASYQAVFAAASERNLGTFVHGVPDNGLFRFNNGEVRA